MIERLTEFATTALVIELTPGPNMSWLALLTAQQGRLAGLRAMAGIALGLSVLAITTSVGATAIIYRFPVFLEILRWAGALLLIFIAAETWFGERASTFGPSFGPFARGLTINLLNPKAASVFLTLVPSFASDRPPAMIDMLTLGTIYIAIATLVHALIVAFSGSFRQLAIHPAREQIVRRSFAVLLLLVALWFFLSTGR